MPIVGVGERNSSTTTTALDEDAVAGWCASDTCSVGEKDRKSPGGVRAENMVPELPTIPCVPLQVRGLLATGRTGAHPDVLSAPALTALDPSYENGDGVEIGYVSTWDTFGKAPLKLLADAGAPMLLASDTGVWSLGGDYQFRMNVRGERDFYRRATSEFEGAFGFSVEAQATFRVDRASQQVERVATMGKPGSPANLVNAWSNARWLLVLDSVEGGSILVAFDRHRCTRRIVAVGGSRREGAICGQPLTADAVFLFAQDGEHVNRIELESGKGRILPSPIPLESPECLSVDRDGKTIAVTGLMNSEAKVAIGDGVSWQVIPIPEPNGIIEPVIGEGWIALRDPAFTVRGNEGTPIRGAGAVFFLAPRAGGWEIVSKTLAPSPQPSGSLGLEFAYNDRELFLNYVETNVEELTKDQRSPKVVRHELVANMGICRVSLH